MKKGKKPSKPKESARGWWQRARPVIGFGLTLAVVVGVVAGVRWLGDEALRGIGPRDRYQVQFADVQCDTPPGTDRPTFLTEVRYLSHFPESFNALDAADRGGLSGAFAAHPWVETVDGVTVEPPIAVRVKLTFRTPVLAARVEGGPVRLVDGHGVLLPEAVPPPGVAALVNPVPAPRSPAGQVWADDTVKRAVELVHAYQPTRLEKTRQGWRLTRPDGKTLAVGR